MQEKVCTLCGVKKPIDEFYKDKYGLYGVRSKCKECDRERHQNYYNNNRDYILDQVSEWKLKIEQDKSLPYWNMRANKENDRCKRHGVFGLISGTELCNLFEEQRHKCFYCGKDLDGDIHIDHIIPISKKGENIIGNIVLACKYCNLYKSDNIFNEEEFFNYVKYNYFRLKEKYETTGETEERLCSM
jgi:5-methylcytosine-specific restriction endonuclease McrA